MGARSLRTLAAAALLAIGLASPAHADDSTASIAHVQRSGHDLQVLVSVPPDAEVDLNDVTVTIDGTSLPAEASKADPTAVRRTAVLAIDTSASMRGARFAAAKRAAQTFLASVPPDVYVGIVSFNSQVSPVLQPTLDRARANRVIDGLTLSRETRLYEGVLAAVQMAGTDGQRSLLVLSDGADTSDTRLGDVAAEVRGADVLLDAVSLGQGGTPKPMQALADAGQGTVISASTQALSRTFSAEADVLARQVLVTATLPDTLTSQEATVTVSLASSAGPLTAQAFTPLGHGGKKTVDPPAPPPVPIERRASPVSAIWLYGGLCVLVLGLAAILLLLPKREKPMTAAERTVAYVEHVTAGQSGDAQQEAEPAFEQAKEAAAKVLSRNSSLEQRIAARLDGAGSELKPAEWLLLHTAIFLGAGLLGILIGGGSLLTGIFFMLLGALGPWWFLGFKRGRRRKKFETLLPDTLQLMSGSLAAGLSLAQSVDTIVREGTEPVAGEFRRVLVETRLGITLDDALEGVAERFDSRDFSWVVMAIRIQRQVGGNLAELLDTVAATIREREYMRRQVAALSAEGRMSAYVLGGLPPMFMLYLFFTNRPYVMVFFTNPIGWLMLGGMILLLSVGIFWMMKMVKVEV